jgi:hypothetical protein
MVSEGDIRQLEDYKTRLDQKNQEVNDYLKSISGTPTREQYRTLDQLQRQRDNLQERYGQVQDRLSRQGFVPIESQRAAEKQAEIDRQQMPQALLKDTSSMAESEKAQYLARLTPEQAEYGARRGLVNISEWQTHQEVVKEMPVQEPLIGMPRQEERIVLESIKTPIGQTPPKISSFELYTREYGRQQPLQNKGPTFEVSQRLYARIQELGGQEALNKIRMREMGIDIPATATYQPGFESQLGTGRKYSEMNILEKAYAQFNRYMGKMADIGKLGLPEVSKNILTAETEFHKKTDIKKHELESLRKELDIIQSKTMEGKASIFDYSKQYLIKQQMARINAEKFIELTLEGGLKKVRENQLGTFGLAVAGGYATTAILKQFAIPSTVSLIGGGMMAGMMARGITQEYMSLPKSHGQREKYLGGIIFGEVLPFVIGAKLGEGFPAITKHAQVANIMKQIEPEKLGYITYTMGASQKQFEVTRKAPLMLEKFGDKILQHVDYLKQVYRLPTRGVVSGANVGAMPELSFISMPTGEQYWNIRLKSMFGFDKYVRIQTTPGGISTVKVSKLGIKPMEYMQNLFVGKWFSNALIEGQSERLLGSFKIGTTSKIAFTEPVFKAKVRYGDIDVPEFRDVVKGMIDVTEAVTKPGTVTRRLSPEEYARYLDERGIINYNVAKSASMEKPNKYGTYNIGEWYYGTKDLYVSPDLKGWEKQTVISHELIHSSQSIDVLNAPAILPEKITTKIFGEEYGKYISYLSEPAEIQANLLENIKAMTGFKVEIPDFSESMLPEKLVRGYATTKVKERITTRTEELGFDLFGRQPTIDIETGEKSFSKGMELNIHETRYKYRPYDVMPPKFKIKIAEVNNLIDVEKNNLIDVEKISPAKSIMAQDVIMLQQGYFTFRPKPESIMAQGEIMLQQGFFTFRQKPEMPIPQVSVPEFKQEMIDWQDIEWDLIGKPKATAKTANIKGFDINEPIIPDQFPMGQTKLQIPQEIEIPIYSPESIKGMVGETSIFSMPKLDTGSTAKIYSRLFATPKTSISKSEQMSFMQMPKIMQVSQSQARMQPQSYSTIQQQMQIQKQVQIKERKQVQEQMQKQMQTQFNLQGISTMQGQQPIQMQEQSQMQKQMQKQMQMQEQIQEQIQRQTNRINRPITIPRLIIPIIEVPQIMLQFPKPKPLKEKKKKIKSVKIGVTKYRPSLVPLALGIRGRKKPILTGLEPRVMNKAGF